MFKPEKRKAEIQRHHEWSMSNEHGDSPVDLSHKTFDDIELFDKSLSLANAHNSTFVDAEFHTVRAIKADFQDSIFRGATLKDVEFRNCNFSYADFSQATLHDVAFIYCNLSRAKFYNAKFEPVSTPSGVWFRDCQTLKVDWSQVEGFFDPLQFLESYFEQDLAGYLVYKAFGQYYQAPSSWKIEPGSVLRENVSYSRTADCACGINVATRDWIKNNIRNTDEVWLCRIRYPWLVDVVVPFQSDGKIRTGRLELLERTSI